VEEPVDTQLRDFADGKIALSKEIEDCVESCRIAIKLAIVFAVPADRMGEIDPHGIFIRRGRYGLVRHKTWSHPGPSLSLFSFAAGPDSGYNAWRALDTAPVATDMKPWSVIRRGSNHE
jgi:hypothetical protein